MSNLIEKLLIKAFDIGADLKRRHKRPEVIKDAVLLSKTSNPYQPKHKENLYLTVQERLQHLYILGATGSGKSKLIEFLVRQDILSRHGFCLTDPHGDLFQNTLNYISQLCSKHENPQLAEHICRKLVIIDPTQTEWVTGFNPLEPAGIDPHSQTMEFMSIFKATWADAHWGPRMEELLRNSLLTLSVNGYTLLEAKTLLVDSSFRTKLIAKLPPGEVKEYWLYRYGQLSENMQSVYREPILNRLSVFLSSPSIRAMFGQAKSTINFRQIMDQGKWLLVNLSKGHLKSNAHLLGGLLIAKLQLAALSRADISEDRRVPFFVFVDEFQNFLNDDFETILSEARKYNMGLIMAHQNIDQLDRKLRSALLGNTFAQIFFRLSNQDASSLAAELSQSEKTIIQRRLVDLKLREAFVKKKGERARLIKTIYTPRPQANPAYTQALKEFSMTYHAKKSIEVEQEINTRHQIISEKKIGTNRNDDKTDPFKDQFAPQDNYEEGNDW